MKIDLEAINSKIKNKSSFEEEIAKRNNVKESSQGFQTDDSTSESATFFSALNVSCDAHPFPVSLVSFNEKNLQIKFFTDFMDLSAFVVLINGDTKNSIPVFDKPSSLSNFVPDD